MTKVGFIGWRGMVGSVLMERMREERDFDGIEPVFFTTSNVGAAGPAIGAAMMMIDSLGETKSAQAVENAMMATMKKMKSQAAGKMGMSTTDVGDTVAGLV